MAINKIAKNLTVTINEKHLCMAKTIEETSEKITIVATEDDLNLVSNKKIVIKGNKS